MKKSRLLDAVFAFIAYGIFATNVQASIIISPVAATASSEFSADFDIGNTIDQSGLSAGFLSGVTNFDAYLAGNPTHTLAALDNEWFTIEGVTSATVNYDLGDVYLIDRLALWNEEFSGVGLLGISISLDNINYTTVASGIMPVDSSPDGLDYGAQIFDFGLSSARYIQFDVSGCPQPDGSPRLFCGIGEVAFSSAVPVPAALWLFGSGLLGLVSIVKRKKASLKEA